MAAKDFLESEVAVAVAVTAAVFSPRARRVLRRGLVYGVAGVLKAGDALSAAAHSAALAAQEAPDAAATMGRQAGTTAGMAGNTMSAVARSAMDVAQQAATSVVQTVQEVSEQVKSARESGRDRPTTGGDF
ncbi:MAG: hypothetical protein M3R24_04775 [Chloroflexota bacterium]|nr:hypothetical protein [Chloroflexota bacterium]